MRNLWTPWPIPIPSATWTIPAAVRRWAKEMGKEMGEDLGDDFEEYLDAAEDDEAAPMQDEL